MLNGYEGICNFILRHHKEGGNKIKRWAANFLQKTNCKQCNGARLKDHHKWYNTLIKILVKWSKLILMNLKYGQKPAILNLMKKRKPFPKI